MLGKLTEKQRRFVEAYMGEAAGNGTQAARLAGYAGTDLTLADVASSNLRKPDVAAAIAERVADDPAISTRKERQAFLTAVQRGDEPAEMPDRLKAVQLLGKMQGDFIERIEINATLSWVDVMSKDE
jgi:phage terminase small subunit